MFSPPAPHVLIWPSAPCQLGKRAVLGYVRVPRCLRYAVEVAPDPTYQPRYLAIVLEWSEPGQSAAGRMRVAGIALAVLRSDVGNAADIV